MNFVDVRVFWKSVNSHFHVQNADCVLFPDREAAIQMTWSLSSYSEMTSLLCSCYSLSFRYFTKVIRGLICIL